MTPIASELLERITSRRARVGVVGLGYVGLPLLTFIFTVRLPHAIGFDLDSRKSRCDPGRRPSYIQDVPTREVRDWSGAGCLSATTDFSELRRMDTINICVPTPLRKTKDPDISYIVSAVAEIARICSAGQLLILESTTYPGTTDELVQPILERRGSGRRGLLPGLFPGASRSGQPDLQDAQRPQGGRRHDSARARAGPRPLPSGDRHRHSGQSPRSPRW